MNSAESPDGEVRRHNLLGIINDLLDFSKIEAGKFGWTRRFLAAGGGGRYLACGCRAGHRKGLELVCNVQPDVPDALVGDAGRLRQVLLNLIGNAIKFTHSGEVVVEVDAAPSPPLPKPHPRATSTSTSRCATLASASPAKQSTIFRAFEQRTLHDSKVRRHRAGPDDLGQLVALMAGHRSR